MQKIIKKTANIIFVCIIVGVLIFLIAYSQKQYLKNAYPIKYSDYVEKYSQEFNMDPLFVYAVIRTESGFSEKATSGIGARGLMQITNETFDWISGRLGEKNKDFDSMYNAEECVKYGVYLLSYLKNTLGCESNVLCGYHAGVNKAKQWLKDEKLTYDNIINPDKIPYSDTKQYVNKVMKTYRIYSDLYKK